MTQKVCVVFGFGPGIGAACARRWLNEGFKVAIIARNKGKLQAFETQHGSNTKGYSCDVTNRQQMEQTVAQIEVDLGPIHTLIYNAGNGLFKNYENTTEQEFDILIGTNVKGLLTAAQLICPKMIQNGGGNVAITGSTASVRARPPTAAFGAAKAAQRMLSQSLAQDLGPKNVHVFYVVVDGRVDSNEAPGTEQPGRVDPNAIADTYWNITQQTKSCWTSELDLKPSVDIRAQGKTGPGKQEN